MQVMSCPSSLLSTLQWLPPPAETSPGLSMIHKSLCDLASGHLSWLHFPLLFSSPYSAHIGLHKEPRMCPSTSLPQGHCLECSSPAVLMVHSLPNPIFALKPFLCQGLPWPCYLKSQIHVTTCPPSLLSFPPSQLPPSNTLHYFLLSISSKKNKISTRAEIFPLLFTALSQMSRTVPCT